MDADHSELDRLKRRLDRERRARVESETIAERATTELFETIQALQRSKAVLDETPDFVALADLSGRLSYLNRACSEMLGTPAGQLDGLILWDFFDDESRARVVDEALPALAGSGQWRGELTMLRPGGGSVPVSQVLIAHRYGDGRIESVSSVSRDTTERREMEERLAQQALHDPLTGLPNRLLLVDRLERALTCAVREEAMVGVLFLDLDRFKLINDGLGHAAGDELLRVVSRRVTSVLRASDTLGRLGGDEFLVVCEAIHEEADALVLARRIEAVLAEPCRLGDDEVFASASIGIAVSSGPTDADELIRRADEAMYQAKQTGKGRYEVFREGLRVAAAERIQTENDLHRALDGGQLCLYYQPIVELSSGRTVGVEALLRWEHPTRGLLAPDQFIALAEESGLIVPIGAWVIAEACRQAASWRQHSERADWTIAVNLSAHQLARPGLAELVDRALSDTDTPAAHLVFEITESILMGAEGLVLAELQALKDLGVGLGTDDFGIGYSSLTYLKRFPVDFFKIDRSFVDGLGREVEDTAITEALLCLGRGLGLKVIAEGVETEGHYQHLCALGCAYAQGYYFCRPQPPESLPTRVSTSIISG